MMELIKTLLADITRKIAPDFKSEILVKIMENKNQGDYTSNVAFVLSKILKKSPQLAAEELAKKLKFKEFSKIEAQNGFINFFLSEECLKHQLGEIIKKKNKYGDSVIGKNYKIQVEFISANPTGPLTIGNGRGGFYGDALANILETQGYKITREFYVNDRGGQILALGRSIKLAGGAKLNLEKTELDNLYNGDYINELAKLIDKNLSVEEAGQKAVSLILSAYIKPVIKKLKIKYDVWFSEKSLYRNGIYQGVMSNLMQKNLIYEKDGATWIKMSKLGDSEDRVLIKSNGNETYFMSDILYHLNKFEIRKFDKVIDVWGADHHGDMLRLSGVLKILGIDLERLTILLNQFVRLVSGGKEFKFSKRAGTFITLKDLVDEVGLDAARFFFLMYSLNTHMDFDMVLAKERSQKNPVYYVQYAHARISSILRKSKIQNPKSEKKSKSQILNYKLFTEHDLNLIRKLIEFPEILADISKNYEVHRLPRYALELAREFHNFYEKERVITDDKKLTSARLSLVMATKTVLANALNLMGIKSPDKM
ncbi:arginine--tRNA ligase [Candidatus Azambacteria bacterium RIFCSPHIGHO2_01_FULL_40_24]|uniref:Arginine--tRNA ligase n=1 Tax=Candidatus Azambacteria bacterium RIFCSPHIGHO2_01_FULL_40_24 TaxID=1797301 RepID=A0A1F5B2J1_9BACT|nr:MAG: arginine--tRNA ligase [Candidatus Azambacteria bacterium RIFCSPHIGHO2_01_FULL_40_24]